MTPGTTDPKKLREIADWLWEQYKGFGAKRLTDEAALTFQILSGKMHTLADWLEQRQRYQK